MTERIERGDSGAHQRGSFEHVERFRHVRERFQGSDHEFLIASVIADSANELVHAVHEVAASAREAGSVLAAMPADPDAFALLPGFDPVSDFVDHSRDFMAGHAWIGNAGKEPILRNDIAMTHST